MLVKGLVRNGSLAPQRARRVPTLVIMNGVDQRNDLVDAALRDEIALVGDLVVAAAESDDHLPQSTIDQILGVEPSRRGRLAAVATRSSRHRT